VTRPARGFIDLVFDEPAQAVIVATEVQSRLDRLEQQIRWAQDKAQSLPSADLWQFLTGTPTISRRLVLRSTVATRELARRFRATLEAAYPARTIDVHRALIEGDVRWPGAGILWADVRGDTARISTTLRAASIWGGDRSQRSISARKSRWSSSPNQVGTQRTHPSPPGMTVARGHDPVARRVARPRFAAERGPARGASPRNPSLPGINRRREPSSG
jgi:hypothetical protein